jgi:AbrB family looped-hinge helix DNA binding protein
MPSATVTSKGQVTIPIQVRRALGLKPGAKIDFYEVEEGVYAMRPRNRSITKLKGCMAKREHVPTIKEMDEAILNAIAEDYLASIEPDIPGSVKG